MTRQHFEYAARLAADLPTHATRLMVADAFAHLFGQFAPRFDTARFYGTVGRLAAEREARETEERTRRPFRDDVEAL